MIKFHNTAVHCNLVCVSCVKSIHPLEDHEQTPIKFLAKKGGGEVEMSIQYSIFSAAGMDGGAAVCDGHGITCAFIWTR